MYVPASHFLFPKVLHQVWRCCERKVWQVVLIDAHVPCFLSDGIAHQKIWAITLKSSHRKRHFERVQLPGYYFEQGHCFDIQSSSNALFLEGAGTDPVGILDLIFPWKGCVSP